MIFEQWHGVFSRKGELYAVEESEEQAKATAAELAGKNKQPWVVRPVLILEKLPDVLLAGAVDFFEKTVSDLRKETAVVREQIAYATEHKEALSAHVGTEQERLQRRAIAAYKLIDALTVVSTLPETKDGP